MVVGACASSGGTSTRRNRDVLTQEELALEPGRSLLETVEALRPEWLRVRSNRTFVSATYVSVIIDGVRQTDGGDALRTFRTSQAEKLEYMSAADATTRYGVDMAGGAILVTLKR
jgi:hypothetical protein